MKTGTFLGDVAQPDGQILELIDQCGATNGLPDIANDEEMDNAFLRMYTHVKS